MPCTLGSVRSLGANLEDVVGVIKLTRLNQTTVAINPDLVLWADASPDTHLCFVGGEKLVVRENVDEVIEKVIEFRRRIASEFPQPRPHPPIAEEPVSAVSSWRPTGSGR
ncbi:MAG: flagellar FlbD family protein [Polyangiaceae bacterium]